MSGDLSTDGLLEAIAATPAASSLLPPGTELAGRYRIAQKLGAGGMGAVYRARDTRLGRDVAVKLLLDEGEGGGQRLLREATAMAQLSHPNLVTVHDAGASDHGVFLAMELVDGRTLRRWLEERPRAWREVRDVFLAAGEGLRALHRAGLVHRDFKPSNVLIDDAGRVRVSDFGLTRSSGPSDGRDILAATVGQAGTPGYMAPEQRAGGHVDARADQFAFCTAMDAALPARAPARLRAALARGRSADPEQRFPSMDGLLAALRIDPARTWRRAGAAAAVVAVAGLATAGLVRRPPACEGATFVAAAWSAPASAAVRQAFLATGRPYAEESYARTANALDRYGAALAGARRELCEEARDHSSALADLQLRCLHGLRTHLDGVVQIFSHADAAVVDRAVQATAQLEAVDTCNDSAALLGKPALPADPAARATLAAVEERATALRADEITGRMKEGLALAPAIVADARATGYAPLLAGALATQGHLLLRARQGDAADPVLREALVVAARAGDDDLGAHVLSRLIWLRGVQQTRFDEAAAMYTIAQAMVARAHEAPKLRSFILGAMGDVLIAKGDYLGARRLHIEAILLADVIGAPSYERALGWNSYAVALRRSGAFPEAEQAIRRSLALDIDSLGPDHPDVGGMLINLGAVLDDRGDSAGAEAAGRRAVAILSGAFGEDSSQVGMAWNTLASALYESGRYPEALDAYDRALRIKERAMGRDSPSTAGTLIDRAAVLNALGRPDEALASAQRAIAAVEKSLGPEHPELADALVVAGEAHAAAHRPGPARAALARAKAIYDKSGGAGRDELEQYHHVMGFVERQEGHLDLALAEQREALAMRTRRVGAGNPQLAPIQKEISALEAERAQQPR